MDKQVRLAFLFLSVLLITSVVYSKFLLSVSMFGWAILAFYSLRKPFRIWEEKGLLLTIGLFALTAFSGINSENTGEWIHHLRMRLPFFALPVALYMIPRPSAKTYFFIQYFLVFLICFTTLPVLYEVLVDFDAIYQGLAAGRPIPTPIQHTKYSLMIAYAIIAGALLIKDQLPHSGFIKKWVLMGTVIYLLIFLHILAVRSGLVVFYLSAILLSAIYAFRQRSFRTLIIALVLAISLPVIGFLSIPSLNKRVHYMIYDIKEYLKDGGDQYSDSDRINSLIVGWEIFKDNPLLGTGIGDLKDECKSKYVEKFGADKYVLYPHNQYLFILAGSGLIGLVLFLVFMWGPLWVDTNYLNMYLLAVVLVFSIGFLFDNALERSFSAGFYAFFITLGLRVQLNVEPE